MERSSLDVLLLLFSVVNGFNSSQKLIYDNDDDDDDVDSLTMITYGYKQVGFRLAPAGPSNIKLSQGHILIPDIGGTLEHKADYINQVWVKSMIIS